MIVTFKDSLQLIAVQNCLKEYIVSNTLETEEADVLLSNFINKLPQLSKTAQTSITVEVSIPEWESVSTALVEEMANAGDYEHDDPVYLFHRENQKVYEQLLSDQLVAEDQMIVQQNAAVVAGESDSIITIVLSAVVLRMVVWSVLIIRDNSRGETHELAMEFYDMNANACCAVMTAPVTFAASIQMNQRTALFILNTVKGIAQMIGDDYALTAPLTAVANQLGEKL